MGQLVRVVPAILLVIGSLIAGGPAAAAPDCETDVSVTMTASVTTTPNQVKYQIDILNLGPCRPSSLTVVDDLSLLTPGFEYAITASTPTSWSCTPGSTSFTCVLPGAKLGIADERYAALTLLVTWPSGAPASTTNKATVSTPYSDPNLIDNTAYSALVNATSSLVTGPLTAGRSQQQKISAPSGQTISAQVRFGGACGTGPDAFTLPCFGNLVRIDVGQPIDGHLVISFLYTAEAVPAGYVLSQAGILHRMDYLGTVQTFSLESCPNRGPLPPWGCIAQRERLSDAALKTPANPKGYYYIITVWTPNNGDWSDS